MGRGSGLSGKALGKERKTRSKGRWRKDSEIMKGTGHAYKYRDRTRENGCNALKK